MKKHIPQLALSVCALAFIFFNAAYVQAGGLTTKSFGGKVTFAPVPPPVLCTGPGTLMVLSSNLKAATDMISSIKKSDDPDKAKNLAKGFLGLLPTFSTNLAKIPVIGGQILGREGIIPNFTKCSIQIGPYKIPIPVYVTTDNYNVSR